MVATRRNAPSSADTEMADPELALRKKPVRKATAKKAAPAKPTRGKKAEPEPLVEEESVAEEPPKRKATRGNKAEPAPVAEEESAVEEVPKPKATRGRPKKAEAVPVKKDTSAAEEAPKPKATRGRPKKTVEVTVEAEPEPEPAEPVKKATRATKAGSVRGRKAAVATPVEEAPELPAPKQAKPTRQTRNTATKAAPLSPKKITQVTKPTTRNAKTAGKKPAVKAAPKATTRTTRGRTVSDENADVPELAQPMEEGEQSIAVSSTPVKKPATRRRAAKQQEAEEIDVTMSTRETTPAGSPAQSRREDAESQADEPSADLSTPEKEAPATDNEESDDELCGPKTPMRRGSPGAEARYHSSAQRTIRKYNEEQSIQTPARRYAELRSQRGTPQTQKPYVRPAPPSSDRRPMTVSRAGSRAFVFKDLRDGAPELPRRQVEEHESIAEEDEDVSFIPDENIIPVDEEMEAEAAATPTTSAPLQLASPPASSTDVEDEAEEEDGIDPAVSADDEENEGLDVDANAAEDQDATILTNEHADDGEGEHHVGETDAESFDADDTVIMNHPEQSDVSEVTLVSSEEDSEASVIHHEPIESRTPETMQWENVQPEQTIAVNFDQHLNHAQTLPQPEPTERLDFASTFDKHLEREYEQADMQSDDSVAGAEEEASGRETDEELVAEESPSLQQATSAVQTPAVDLNDYFDMKALSEPTQVIDFASQPEEITDTEMDDAAAEPPAEAAEQNVPANETIIEQQEEQEGEQGEPVESQASPEPVQQGEGAAVEQQPSIDPFEVEDEDADATANGSTVDLGMLEEPEVPHYARTTFAFDARRKSLPATSMFTPVKAGTRPSTSDGASMPRIARPFDQSWWARSRANSIVATESATPQKRRPSTAHATPAKNTDPEDGYPVFAPREVVDHSQSITAMRFRDVSEKDATRRQTFHRAISGKTQEAPTETKQSIPVKPATPKLKERYPALGSRSGYIDHSQTAAPPARFQDPADKPTTRRQTFHRAASGKTQEAPTPPEISTPEKMATPVAKPKERFPALGSQANYVNHSQTVAPPARFQDVSEKPNTRRQTIHRANSGKTVQREQPSGTPANASSPKKASTPIATPKERFPALGSRPNYVDHAQTVAPPARFQEPTQSSSNRRQTIHRAASGKTVEREDAPATPDAPSATEIATPQPTGTPAERFPRRTPRVNYQDHAKTVAAPRFQTPPRKSPVKRSATARKPASMRKTALQNTSSTPMKTPLKAPAMTPGQEAMTPHPAAPLRGVVALVEVYTLEGASASAPFTALLHRLGAKATRTWTDKVTHVIFKDGSPTTLQRVRLHNKDVASGESEGKHVFCVNSRWVSDCDASGMREDEADEAYAVDVEEVPRGGKRRRKSMEPSALLNVGGNIVRDRKSSLGRGSSLRFGESPAKKARVEEASVEGKENSAEEEADDPATPDWIAGPEKLVQQTAPINKVRKLELAGKESRRMTAFWEQ